MMEYTHGKLNAFGALFLTRIIKDVATAYCIAKDFRCILPNDPCPVYSLFGVDQLHAFHTFSTAFSQLTSGTFEFQNYANCVYSMLFTLSTLWDDLKFNSLDRNNYTATLRRRHDSDASLALMILVGSVSTADTRSECVQTVSQIRLDTFSECEKDSSQIKKFVVVGGCKLKRNVEQHNYCKEIVLATFEIRCQNLFLILTILLGSNLTPMKTVNQNLYILNDNTEKSSESVYVLWFAGKADHNLMEGKHHCALSGINLLCHAKVAFLFINWLACTAPGGKGVDENWLHYQFTATEDARLNTQPALPWPDSPTAIVEIANTRWNYKSFMRMTENIICANLTVRTKGGPIQVQRAGTRVMKSDVCNFCDYGAIEYIQSTQGTPADIKAHAQTKEDQLERELYKLCGSSKRPDMKNLSVAKKINKTTKTNRHCVLAWFGPFIGWKIIQLLYVSIIIHALARPLSKISVGAETWQVSYANSLPWISVASSSSGQYAYAVTNPGYIYMNANYGASSEWIISYENSQYWTSIATIGSAQYVFASVEGGYIYMNSNFGSATNWTVSYSNPQNWNAIASSSSGQYVYATSKGGNVFMNSNYGSSESWVTTSGGGSNYWSSITTSSTGQYAYVATDETVNQIYYIYANGDYGSGGYWPYTYTDSLPWSAVTISSSGQYVYAVNDGGYIYMNDNFGYKSSWIASFSTSELWKSIATSSSGQYAYAVASGGYVYSNNNYGSSSEWIVAYVNAQNWQSIAVSSDALFVYAVVNNGYIFSTVLMPTSQPSSGPTVHPSSLPTSKPTKPREVLISYNLSTAVFSTIVSFVGAFLLYLTPSYILKNWDHEYIYIYEEKEKENLQPYQIGLIKTALHGKLAACHRDIKGKKKEIIIEKSMISEELYKHIVRHLEIKNPFPKNSAFSKIKYIYNSTDFTLLNEGEVGIVMRARLCSLFCNLEKLEAYSMQVDGTTKVVDVRDDAHDDKCGISATLFDTLAAEYYSLSNSIFVKFEANQLRDCLLVPGIMQPRIMVWQKLFFLSIPIYYDLAYKPGPVYNFFTCNGRCNIIYNILTLKGFWPACAYGICFTMFKSRVNASLPRLREEQFREILAYIEKQNDEVVPLLTTNVLHDGRKELISSHKNDPADTIIAEAQSGREVFQQATRSVDILDSKSSHRKNNGRDSKCSIQ